jgi:hypothetical protein
MGPVQRVDGVMSETIDGKAVLIDASGRELITLNQVGSVVWDAIDGRRGQAELVDVLGARFPDVAADRLAADVDAFLNALAAAGLIRRDR